MNLVIFLIATEIPKLNFWNTQSVGNQTEAEWKKEKIGYQKE